MLHFSHCEKENLVILMMRVRQGESDGFNIYKNVKDLNEEEYNMFVAEVKEHSIYKVDETPGYGTPLLTLSTCSYHRNDGAGREVVVCYLEKEFDKNGNPVKRTLST